MGQTKMSIEEKLNPQRLSSKALKELRPTVYYGTMVHTPKLGEIEALPNCAILVDQSGLIKDISKNCQSVEKDLLNKHGYNHESVNVIDITAHPYQFFFPGFVDTHIHAPQFPNAGIFGNSTLLDWLDTYTFPLESSFRNLNKANKIYKKVVEQTLENGTTTASYFATIHPGATKLLSNICFKEGQRALIGRLCMDDNSPDFYTESHDDVKTNTIDVCDHINKIQDLYHKANDEPIVRPTLTPRFAPSCSKKSLDWLGEYRAKHNYHVQSHVSENVDEIELVSKLFPESSCYTGVYHDSNLLSNKTVLAHGVHLTDEEISILRKTRSGISHCPISNSSLTSGETKVRKLLDKGVKVSLGTDMSGGFSPSILCSARHAHLVSRHLAMKTQTEKDKLSCNEVLYLGTMGGAKCLDLDSVIGDFQIGKKWESQLVDLKGQGSRIDIFDWQLPEYLIKRNGYHHTILKKEREGYEDEDDWDYFHGLSLDQYFEQNNDRKWLKDDGSFFDQDQGKFEDLVAKWLFNGDDRNTIKVYVNGRCVVDKSH